MATPSRHAAADSASSHATDRGEPALPSRGHGSFLERAREFRRLYQGPEGLFWIRRVNHPAGALIALPLLHTRITPNMVTLAGVAVQLLGALYAAFLAPPAALWSVLVVILLWQVAFSLDCADGQLARARGATSAFGAWLDQMADSVGRSAVYIALSIYLARALTWDATIAAAFGSAAVSLALIQTFSTWQRVSVIGARPVGERASAPVRLMYLVRHLLDYGAFLFVAALLMLLPVALLAFLVAAAIVNAAYIAAQITLSWRSHLASARSEDGVTSDEGGRH